jgi:hypothetical protein
MNKRFLIALAVWLGILPQTLLFLAAWAYSPDWYWRVVLTLLLLVLLLLPPALYAWWPRNDNENKDNKGVPKDK